MAKTRSPSAGVIVYNYVDRGGTKNISDESSKPILITKSIISIKTSKNKASSSGSFEIILAPSRNWIAALTGGSWLEIHMSPFMMSDSDLSFSLPGKNYQKTLKMIGVIDTVRLMNSVDQATGARSSVYVVRGRDWGAALESFLYIDTAANTTSNNPLLSAVNLANRIQYTSGDIGIIGIFSPAEIARKLIDQWGSNMAFTSKNLINLSDKAQYIIPDQLARKIASHSSTNPFSNKIADKISLINGKLSSLDKYSPSNESLGLLNPQSLVGTNTVWQLLQAHSNVILNELITELRWGGPNESQVQLALYQRIKPFWVRSTSKPNYVSSFFHVKQNNIPKDDVLAIDVGDNTEDVINFIEILPDMSISSLPPHEKIGLVANQKSASAITDSVSMSRFGLKPLQFSSIFGQNNQGKFNWSGITNWLKPLEEWYFDCHKMLNGTATLMGQDSYIGVGENIVIDSSILGETNFVSSSNVGLPIKGLVKHAETKFIAHIESVNHVFRYLPNGSRSFMTNISFVRGVIANNNATSLINDTAFGVETKVNKLSEDELKVESVRVE